MQSGLGISIVTTHGASEGNKECCSVAENMLIFFNNCGWYALNRHPRPIKSRLNHVHFLIIPFSPRNHIRIGPVEQQSVSVLD